MIQKLNGKYSDRAFEALPELARKDLRETEEAYRRYRIGWFSRASWRADDRYLQAQGIREGIRS